MCDVRKLRNFVTTNLMIQNNDTTYESTLVRACILILVTIMILDVLIIMVNIIQKNKNKNKIIIMMVNIRLLSYMEGL